MADEVLSVGLDLTAAERDLQRLRSELIRNPVNISTQVNPAGAPGAPAAVNPPGLSSLAPPSLNSLLAQHGANTPFNPPGLLSNPYAAPNTVSLPALTSAQVASVTNAVNAAFGGPPSLPPGSQTVALPALTSQRTAPPPLASLGFHAPGGNPALQANTYYGPGGNPYVNPQPVPQAAAPNIPPIQSVPLTSQQLNPPSLNAIAGLANPAAGGGGPGGGGGGRGFWNHGNLGGQILSLYTAHAALATAGRFVGAYQSADQSRFEGAWATSYPQYLRERVQEFNAPYDQTGLVGTVARLGSDILTSRNSAVRAAVDASPVGGLFQPGTGVTSIGRAAQARASQVEVEERQAGVERAIGTRAFSRVAYAQGMRSGGQYGADLAEDRAGVSAGFWAERHRIGGEIIDQERTNAAIRRRGISGWEENQAVQARESYIGTLRQQRDESHAEEQFKLAAFDRRHARAVRVQSDALSVQTALSRSLAAGQYGPLAEIKASEDLAQRRFHMEATEGRPLASQTYDAAMAENAAARAEVARDTRFRTDQADSARGYYQSLSAGTSEARASYGRLVNDNAARVRRLGSDPAAGAIERAGWAQEAWEQTRIERNEFAVSAGYESRIETQGLLNDRSRPFWQRSQAASLNTTVRNAQLEAFQNFDQRGGQNVGQIYREARGNVLAAQEQFKAGFKADEAPSLNRVATEDPGQAFKEFKSALDKLATVPDKIDQLKDAMTFKTQ